MDTDDDHRGQALDLACTLRRLADAALLADRPTLARVQVYVARLNLELAGLRPSRR